jgi:hypothetical protein
MESDPTAQILSHALIGCVRLLPSVSEVCIPFVGTATDEDRARRSRIAAFLAASERGGTGLHGSEQAGLSSCTTNVKYS